MAQIVRFIRFFDRKSEKLAGEISLPALPLAPLQALFAQSADNPMYDCFEINESHRAYFEVLAGCKLDFEAYDYFLECDAVSEPCST